MGVRGPRIVKKKVYFSMQNEQRLPDDIVRKKQCLLDWAEQFTGERLIVLKKINKDLFLVVFEKYWSRNEKSKEDMEFCLKHGVPYLIEFDETYYNKRKRY